MKIFLRLLLLIGVISCLSSGCERRTLLDPSYSTELMVKVDIRGLQNITCDIYNEKIPLPVVEPEMMRVLFYKPGTTIVAGESYISNISVDSENNRILSGVVGILPGTYEMLVYNFDTRSTMIRNDDHFMTIEAYTDPVIGQSAERFQTRIDESTSILYQPDHIVVASSAEEVIPHHNEVHVIETAAESIVETFYLQVKVKGLEYVSSAQAVLTGMVGSNMLGERRPVTEKESAIYFTLNKSDDKGVPVLCNIFNTFGRIAGSTNDLWVAFDINTVDGRVLSMEYDITHLFETDECKNHRWLLFDEEIVIPPPPSQPGTGGGFEPSVGNWDEEKHDIIL